MRLFFVYVLFFTLLSRLKVRDDVQIILVYECKQEALGQYMEHAWKTLLSPSMKSLVGSKHFCCSRNYRNPFPLSPHIVCAIFVSLRGRLNRVSHQDSMEQSLFLLLDNLLPFTLSFERTISYLPSKSLTCVFKILLQIQRSYVI